MRKRGPGAYGRVRVAFRSLGGGALKGEFEPEVREEREGSWKLR